MLSVKVPKYTEVGSRERLYCNYQLNNDTLYSVKWYKNGDEFYRQDKLVLIIYVYYFSITVPSYHFDSILHCSIFNRYVPKDNPKSQVFNVPWVRVDVSKIFIVIVISSD